jgi:tRNA(fMet)-specific endonuclease VapC
VSYLLDTNTCIGHLTGRAPQVTEHLRRHSVHEIVLCSVVKAELLTGARKSRRAAENLALVEEFSSPFVSYPFDDQAAEQYASIRANLESLGTPIGPNDLLIAAIALARQSVVVTSNTREFRRISALVVEDWTNPRV